MPLELWQGDLFWISDLVSSVLCPQIYCTKMFRCSARPTELFDITSAQFTTMAKMIIKKTQHFYINLFFFFSKVLAEKNGPRFSLIKKNIQQSCLNPWCQSVQLVNITLNLTCQLSIRKKISLNLT